MCFIYSIIKYYYYYNNFPYRMSLFNLSVVAFDESPFLVTSSRSPSRSTLYHESEVFYFSSSSHYPCHLVLSSSPTSVRLYSVSLTPSSVSFSHTVFFLCPLFFISRRFSLPFVVVQIINLSLFLLFLFLFISLSIFWHFFLLFRFPLFFLSY